MNDSHSKDDQVTLELLDAIEQRSDVRPADAYIITGLDDPLKMYRTVMTHMSEPERVLVPAVLGLEAAIRNDT